MTRRIAQLSCLALTAITLPLAACGKQASTSSPSASQQVTGGKASAAASTGGSSSAAPSSSGSRASTGASPDRSQKVDCTQLKCIALTYDDGPSQYTPQLIKTYEQHHATATFFMLGNAAQTFPDTVKQVYAAGFEIGNHTYDHKALSSLTNVQVANEVSRTNVILKGLTGVEPVIMRPPYAARSKRTDAVCGQQGLAVIVWSNSPEDWVAGHNTPQIVTRLTLQRSSRNAIILMHDIHKWTVDAAPAIIEGLQKEGYTLVTVSQLLGTTTPGTLYPR